MKQFANRLHSITPFFILIVLGAMGIAFAADLAPQKAKTIDLQIITTQDLWQDFYPVADRNEDNIEELKSRMGKLTRKPEDKLIVDLGSFSSQPILNETSYNAGSLGYITSMPYDSVNIGQNETWMKPDQIARCFSRKNDTGESPPLVSSFSTSLETSYSMPWSPYIEVEKEGVKILIGGTTRDIQRILFVEPEKLYTNPEATEAAKLLVQEAEKRNAFPVLLLDADSRGAERVAREVKNLPLILCSAVNEAEPVREVMGTTIISTQQPGAIQTSDVKISIPTNKVEVKRQRKYAYREDSSKDNVRFWPSVIEDKDNLPEVALPEIGAELDNVDWLKKMDVVTEYREKDVIPPLIHQTYPTIASPVCYYNLENTDGKSSRVIYIRHRLPVPYPSFFIVIQASHRGEIEKIYTPQRVFISNRLTRLPEWCQSLVGDNASRLERKLREGQTDIFHSIILADIYTAIKILDDGAL